MVVLAPRLVFFKTLEPLLGELQSSLSTMPEGLINTLKKEEILDLIAYMEAAGRETHPLFQK